MANEYVRKEWQGGTVKTTLTGSLAAGATPPTSFTVTDASSFPTGASAFVLVIDRGLTTEEKVLVTAGGRAGNALSGVQRGYDGSTAQVHAAGAVVEHVLDAYTVDQANAMATTMTTAGDLIYKTTTGSNALFSRLAVGTNGYPLVANAGTPGYAQLTSAGIGAQAVTETQLHTSVAGAGLTGGAGTALAVNPDGATLEVVADQVRVKALGIGNSHLATNAVTDGTVATGAAIAYSKLALTNGIVNSDVNTAAGIAYSKLNLASSVAATDFASAVKPLVVCTSTTRPASPASPTMIYETDKDRIRVWDGATWAYIGGNGPRVTLSRASGTPQTIGSGLTVDITWPTEVDADGLHVAGSSTITVAEAGIYSIAWGLDSVTSGGTIGTLGYIVTLTAGTKTYSVPYSPPALGTSSVSGSTTLPLTASSTVKLSVTNGTSATTFTTSGDLYLTLMCR